MVEMEEYAKTPPKSSVRGFGSPKNNSRAFKKKLDVPRKALQTLYLQQLYLAQMHFSPTWISDRDPSKGDLGPSENIPGDFETAYSDRLRQATISYWSHCKPGLITSTSTLQFCNGTTQETCEVDQSNPYIPPRLRRPFEFPGHDGRALQIYEASPCIGFVGRIVFQRLGAGSELKHQFKLTSIRLCRATTSLFGSARSDVIQRAPSCLYRVFYLDKPLDAVNPKN
ncbi:hypothetical protein DFH06DRAFT_1296718 [Mycena polygramma]|nr:hypothetical protein DFH06DRAFT_1296718 [Mycena polygramma]